MHWRRRDIWCKELKWLCGDNWCDINPKRCDEQFGFTPLTFVISLLDVESLEVLTYHLELHFLDEVNNITLSDAIDSTLRRFLVSSGFRGALHPLQISGWPNECHLVRSRQCSLYATGSPKNAVYAPTVDHTLFWIIPQYGEGIQGHARPPMLGTSSESPWWCDFWCKAPSGTWWVYADDQTHFCKV